MWTGALVRRALGVGAAVVVGLAWTFAAHAAPAHADPASQEYEFLASINAARAGQGVAPLAMDGQLVSVARAWSAVMASVSTLSHNPNLHGLISGGRKLGENVGMGPSVASIESAFEASPHHLANMMDPAFNQVGLGVVVAGGTIWVTEDYKQASGGATVAAVACDRNEVSPSASIPPPATRMTRTMGMARGKRSRRVDVCPRRIEGDTTSHRPQTR